MHSKRNSPKSSSGYGLGVLMIVLLTMVVAIVSAQMTIGTVLPIQNRGIRDRNVAWSVAQAALPLARAYLQTQIDNNVTINQGYTWLNQTVTAPSNPTNFAAGNTTLGNFNVTVTRKNGNFYLVRIDATAGSAKDTQSQLVELSPSYNCAIQGAAIESTILSGNIASISDADLIKYAKKSCMIKKSTPPSYTVTPGTGASCAVTITNNSAIDVVRGDLSPTCIYNANGTFANMAIGNMMAGSRLNSNTAVTRTIELGDMLGDYLLSKRSMLIVNAANTADITIKMNNFIAGMDLSDVYDTDGLNQLWTAGGNDTIYMAGNLIAGTVKTGAGNDTFIVKGYTDFYGDSCNALNSDPALNETSGIYMEGGNDKLYLNEVRGAWCGAIDMGDGNNEVYLDNATATTADIDIDTGDGNDIIACGGWMSASCIAGNDLEIFAGAGNDIISIDANLFLPNGRPLFLDLYGEGGNNILYVKSFDKGTTNNPQLDIRATDDGNSLTIIGGSSVGGGSNTGVGGDGPNNVLLIKTGSTFPGTNFYGFARTLYY